MEPIRPDDDELRATRDSNIEKPKGKSSGNYDEKPPVKGGKGGNGGGNGGRSPSGPLLMLALLIVAGAGAVGWYQQDQRIAQMENEMEEADNWVRQSKLALARFEGELSETGEDLEQAGQSIEQRISQQEERLDTANSEIRKLWGVANDRNKSRLNDHEARLDALDESVEQVVASADAVTVAVNELEQAIEAQVSALESSLRQELMTHDERIAGQASALDELESSVASVEGQVESRLKRFEREQSLTIDGLEGRISALEEATDALSGEKIASISSELGTLKRTVESIDSSRAQLTSRLVRLSEEVSQLRSQAASQ